MKEMEHTVVGTTHLGLHIDAYHFGAKGRRLLLLAGVHGNEPEGVFLACLLKASLSETYPYSFSMTLIPEFNPEGLYQSSRLNSNGVDLNRNLPTRDWQKEAFSKKYPPGDSAGSEPETKALMNWIEKEEPSAILSLHSFERCLMNTNGDCRGWAEAMHKVNRYPIEESIGYPTPGCLGTYTGLERSIPTITYELERGLPLFDIKKTHQPALLAGFKFLEDQWTT